MSTDSPVRVRFAPSPTGHLHVGSGRTALFNFLLARKTGGQFILRIEDTDTSRNVEGAIPKIVEDLHWLGLSWDEGIEVGGPNEPYFQSQRLDLYNAKIQQLLDEGKAYYAWDTTEELQAMRDQAMAEKRNFRYPRPATFPSADQAEQARADGKPVVVRFIAPDQDITVSDRIMGEVTISAEEMDDFIIKKADGMPTYHLANVVDDGEMRVNFVIRGQEFLSQSPRHIALQRALGYPTPQYAHMPLTMDMQGRKLSKRDGAVEVFSFRKMGYLPEALVNFIALLGWSPGDHREKFSLDELIEAFSVERMGRVNAKFDRDKLLAFNTNHIAAASQDRLLAAFNDWLALNPESPLAAAELDEPTRRKLLEANKGFRIFSDIEGKSGFIYQPDEAITFDEKAVKKVLKKNEGEGYVMLEKLLPQLEADQDWSAQTLEAVIAGTCAAENVGMGKVAQPIRVAVSGNTISPAIYDTLILLGKEKTIARIRRCLARR